MTHLCLAAQFDVPVLSPRQRHSLRRRRHVGGDFWPTNFGSAGGRACDDPLVCQTAASQKYFFPKRQWNEMTTAEFEALNKEQCIALLPVSATEQHGPHLPVSVDAAINGGILGRALELLPESVPLTVLPPVPYGKSVEHDDFAGTLSLSANTLAAVWTDIGEAVARAGIKKLIIFNSHGGQPQVMDIVARDLRKRFGMLVVTVSWFGFSLPDGLFDEDELKHGLHAGDVETSIMRYLHPELVNMERAVGRFLDPGRKGGLH